MATAVGGGSDVEVGFAKLQGEDFEYYMQSYSIILGRNSKKATVDVDLSSLGGGSRFQVRVRRPSGVESCMSSMLKMMMSTTMRRISGEVKRKQGEMDMKLVLDFEYKFYCSDCYLNLVRLGLNDSDPTTLYMPHVCREEEIKDVNITEEEAFEILRLANQSSGSSSCNGSRSLINGAKNAWDMLHEEESLPRITTSCSDLDSILGGGISCRDVTEH
ncbi:unnamed protein product [Arabidopsis arenosa]|uniref:RecA family profile 1 domain-containing protein n=1 Tax=Arabidopsis arenosa TaxID=38785 RepID=A0A8S1ZSZ6_ARAAE|nr:unnamed protein product [Arabidopsis arenosa]